MPDPTRIQPAIPNVRSRQYSSEDLVQARAFVPGVDPLNKHDLGLREGVNQTYLRGSNQTWYQQVANAGLRFIPSVGAKLGEGFASSVSLLGEWAKSADPDHDFDWSAAMSSPMALAFSNLEKFFEGKAPIYASQKYLEGNLADKIWTSSFWTQDFADGIEFLASAYIPGAAIGKIGSLSKLAQASKFTKVRALGKSLEAAKTAVRAGEMGNLSSTLLTTAYNTMAESMIEGSHLYREVKQDLKNRFPQMSEEEIERKASVAARNTFGYNMLYLAVPNFLQTVWLHGTSNMSKLRKLREVGKITNKEIKQSIGKNFVKGFISEGLWEENIQNAVTEMEGRVAKGTQQPGDSQFKFLGEGITGLVKAIPDILTFGNLGTSAAAGSSEDQAATATLLGGLIGGPMSMWGAYRENKQISDALEPAQERLNTAIDFVRNATNSMPEYITPILKNFGKNEKDGSTKWADDEGGLHYDPRSKRLIDFNHAIDKSIQQEAALATVNGDPIAYNHAVEKAVSNLAWELSDMAKQHDLTEDDIDYLIDTRVGNIAEDKDSPFNKESAEQLGIKNIIAERKIDVKARMKQATAAKEKTYSAEDFSEDKIKQQFNRDIARAIYYAETLNLSLDKMRREVKPENQKALDDIDAMIKDNKDAVDFFTNPRSREKLVNEYKRQVAPYLSISEELEQTLGEMALQKLPEEKAKLEQKAEDLKFRLMELQAIEGTEEIIGTTNPDTKNSLGMFSVIGSDMFGSRQHPKAVKQPSLKQIAYWNIGEGRLLENKLEETWTQFKGSDTNEVAAAEGVGLVTSIIKEIISKGAAVRQEKVQPIIDELKEYLSNKISTLEEEKDSVEDDEIFDTLDSLIEDLESLKQDLENNSKKIEDLSKANDALLDATLNNKNEIFKRKFLELFNNISISIFARNPIIRNQESGELEVRPDFEEETLTVQLAITRLKVSLRNIQGDETFKDLEDLHQKQIKLLEDYILPFVASKSEQRAAQQVQFEEKQTNLLLEYFNSKEVTDVLKLISPNFEDKIKDLQSNSLDKKAYQHILKIIDEVKEANKSKELTEALTSAFSSKLSLLINSLINTGMSPNAANILIRDNVNLNSIQNAIRVILTRDNPFLLEYEKTFDLYSLYNQLNNIKWVGISDKVKAQLELLMQVVESKDNIDFINAITNSKLSLKSQVEAETILSNKERNPTFQQRHAAIWIMHLLTNPTTENSRIIALRGIIGTGKTKITLNHIIKALIEAKTLKQEEVLVMGHSEKSSNQLNKLIKGVENSKTWDNYAPTMEESFNEISLIVIDEAAALSDRSFDEILHVMPKNIKVLLAGDGSQNVVSDLPGFSFSAEVNRVLPLNIVYRTNIASLTNGALQFKDKVNPVREVQFQSNKVDASGVISDPSGSLGVMAMTEEEILSSLNSVSNRDRILIVANPIEALKYRALLSDIKIEVIDYLAVQGTEAEEVYIILPFNSNIASGNKTFTIESYNSAIYTSIGRATKFAAISLSGVSVNQVHVANMEEQASSLARDFEVIKDEHLSNLNSLRSMFNMTPIRIEDKPKEEPKEEVTPTVSEDEELVDSPTEDSHEEESVEIDEQELITLPANEYLLSFPTNENLPSPTHESQHVDYSKLYVLRSKGSPLWIVVAKHKAYPSNKSVYPVAVLGNSDLNESSKLGKYLRHIGAYTTDEPTTTIPGFAANASLSRGFEVTNLDDVAVASFETGSVMHSIQFNYGKKEERIVSDLSVRDVVVRFVTSLFTQAAGFQDLKIPDNVKKILISKERINWKELRDIGWDINVKIYNGGEVAEFKNQAFRPTVGRPYLVLSKIRWESENRKPTPPKSFFIELKARRYNPETMSKVSYMKEFMEYIHSFETAFNTIQSLFPIGIIKLNNREKDVNGKSQEGLYQRLLDFYAKKAYIIKATDMDAENNVIKSLSRSNTFNTNTVKEFFKDEISNLTDDQFNILLQNLDVIVPLTYSIKTGDKLISYGEWKALKVKGDITFTHSIKNKAYKEAIRRGKTEEQAIKDAGISEEDNVRYTQVTDVISGATSKVQEDRISRGDGPLQDALDIIASANRHLSIATERTRINSEGEQFSYHGAKSLFSTLEKGSAFQGAIRNWLNKDLSTLLLNIATKNFPGVDISKVFDIFNEDLPSSAFARSDFFEALPDGTTFEDRVRVRYKNEKITFAYQDSNNKGSLKPLAMFAWVNAIVGHVKTANAESSMQNLFKGTELETIEGVEKWRDSMKKEYEQIYNQHVNKPLDESDIKQLLEQNPISKEYKNVFTPLVKSGYKIKDHKEESINRAGKLEDTNSVEMLESILQTSFQGVVPTRVSIKIPSTTKINKKKLSQGPVLPLSQQSTISLDEELSKLSTNPNSIKNTTTIGELMDKLPKFEPYLERVRTILALNSELRKVLINEIKGWEKALKASNLKDNLISAYSLEHNAIETSSIPLLEQDPVLLLHEIIHAQSLYLFYKNPLELSKEEAEFLEELNTIYNEFVERDKASEGKLSEKVFQKTISTLNVREFIASMTSPGFYTELSKELMSEDKIPSLVRDIWKRIWNAVINFLITPNLKDINLADATYASFEKFMTDKFKENNNIAKSQLGPAIPPSLPQAEDEEERFEKLVKGHEDEEAFRIEWEHAIHPSERVSILSQLEKKSYGISELEKLLRIDSKFSPTQLSDELKKDYYEVLVDSEQEAIDSLAYKGISTIVVFDNVKLFHYTNEKSPNFSRLGGSVKEAKKQLLLDKKEVDRGLNLNNQVVIGWTISKETMNNIVNTLTDQGFYKKDCI